MTSTRRFVAVLLPLVLCGCMEYTEEVRIAPDGAGSIRVDSAVHKMLLDAEELDHNRELNHEYMAKLESRADVERAEFHDFFDDRGLYHTVYEVSVHDYTTLPKLHMVGVGSDEGIHFQSTSDGGLSYVRVLDPDASEQHIPEAFRDMRVAGKTVAEWDADFDGDLDRFEVAAIVLAAKARAEANGDEVPGEDDDQPEDGEEPGDEDEDGGYYATYRLIAPQILTAAGAAGFEDGVSEGATVAEWKYPVYSPDVPASLHAEYAIPKGGSSSWGWVALIVAGLLFLILGKSFRGWWKSGGLRKFALKRGLV